MKNLLASLGALPRQVRQLLLWLPLSWLLVWCPAPALAQEKPSVFQGVVRDAGSQAPVPYASIGLPGVGVGTVSNAEGDFRLILPAGSSTDSVVVSCIGYLPRRLRLEPALLASSQVLLLQPQRYELHEVAVQGYTAQSLLAQAVRQTNRQLLSPALVSGYYREFALTDGQYTKFADALVDYYFQANPRRPRKPEIQVHVRESRAGEVPPTDRTASIRAVPSPIAIGEASGYKLIANNPFLDSLNFSRYAYTIQASTGNDADFYLLSFTPTSHDSDYLEQGTVRINRQTLVIEAFDSELPAAMLPYSQEINLLIIKAKVVSYTAHQEFHQVAGQLYPGLARLQVGIALSGASGKFRLDFVSVFAATGVAAVATSPFPKSELYNGSLYKKGTNYQHPYWLENNIVLASKEEEAVIALLAK